MQSFVVNYDYKSGAVRLGVNSNAPEGTMMVTDQPTPDPEDTKRHRTGLIIAILILIVAGLIVGGWYLMDRRRQRNHEIKNIAYNEIERSGRVHSVDYGDGNRGSYNNLNSSGRMLGEHD